MTGALRFILLVFLSLAASVDALAVKTDVRPPVSSVTYEVLPNMGGYRFTIRAADKHTGIVSGVKEIRWFTNAFAPEHVVPGDKAVVDLPLSGWTVLAFWAIDRAGNAQYPYNTFTRDPGMTIVPSQLEITTQVGTIGAAAVMLGQSHPNFPANVLEVSTDSGWFWPEPGACVFSQLGVVGCAVQIYFFAPAEGDYSATLWVKTDDPNQTYYTTQLRGHGRQPGMRFFPDPVEFPFTTVGSTSIPKTVTLQSTGVVPLTISGISASGPGFQVVSNRCPTVSLPASVACDVDVVFTPVAYGSHAGALEVTSNLPGPPRYVAFEAFGVLDTTIIATPSKHDFEKVNAGDAGKMDFEIYNDGPAPFPVREFVIDGPGAAAYLITSAGCKNGIAPVVLEPGQACWVSVAFVPTAAGRYEALLRMESSIGLPPFDITLVGSSP